MPPDLSARPDASPAPRAERPGATARDPLAGARPAGPHLLRSAMRAATTDRGVHAESLFAMLGALGGFACQIAARQAGAGGTCLAMAQTAEGRRFFFGDAINAPLLEDRLSLWSLAAGAAQALGATPPDPVEIVRHVAATVGTPVFGVPRIPDGHGPAALPADYVRALWPAWAQHLETLCATPRDWPLAFGLAVQEGMEQARHVLAAGLALVIVMECAVPMAKLDPAEIGLPA